MHALRPVGGEIVESILAPVQEGGAQEGGEGEIILRGGEEGERGEQVLDGEFFAEPQHVRACDAQALAFAGGDDLVEQGAARLDQDEHVALGHGTRREVAVLVELPEHLFAGHAPDLGRDAIRHQGGMVIVGDRAHRIGPVSAVGLRRCGDVRPEVDPAGQLLLERDMGDHFAHALAVLRGKGFIDGAQDFRCRAEAVCQFLAHEGAARRPQPRGEVVAHVAEDGRVGALERIDRLLVVAHDEQRLFPAAGAAVARGHLAREMGDGAPLQRAGVLRLVHQDVVDGAVEAIEHPVGHGRVRQQGLGLLDQVVEV